MDALRGSDPPLAKIHALAVAQDTMHLYLDDPVFSDGSWHSSYHLIPGATIGGYMGVHAAEAESWGDRWWYHTSDTGTTLAVTDDAGAEISTSLPSFFGSPEYFEDDDGAGGGDPDPRVDNLVFSSKLRFDLARLDYSTHRWYDPERGRWMSREPSGADGPNLYHFVFNDPVNGYDPDGLITVVISEFGPNYPDTPRGDVNIHGAKDWTKYYCAIASELESGDTVIIFGHGGESTAAGVGTGAIKKLPPVRQDLSGVQLEIESCEFACNTCSDFEGDVAPLWSSKLGGVNISAPIGLCRSLTIGGPPYPIPVIYTRPYSVRGYRYYTPPRSPTPQRLPTPFPTPRPW